MKKIAIHWIAVVKLCVILLYPLVALVFPPQVAAANNCKDNPYSVNISGLPSSFAEGTKTSLSITLSGLNYLANDVTYQLQVYDEGDVFRDVEGSSNPIKKAGGQTQMVFTIPDGKALQSDGSDIASDDHYVYLYTSDGTNTCFVGNYNTTPAVPQCDSPIKITQKRSINGVETACYGGCFTEDTNVLIEANVKNINGQPYSGPVYIFIDGDYGFQEKPVNNGKLSFNHISGTKGLVTAKLYALKNDNVGGATTGVGQFGGECASYTLNYRNACDDANPSNCQTDPTTATPAVDPNQQDIAMTQRVFQLCTQITNTELKGKCDECYGKEGVWTAVGCIERTPQSIVKSFLEIGLGVGGAITLLMCLTAGFMLTTSQGDPTKVNEARDMITSAVIGLLFIIFSVFILQFIGVTIFNIPAFGAATTP